MVNKNKTENKWPSKYRLENWKPEFLQSIIFIIDQIKTYVTVFNGFQNVC